MDRTEERLSVARRALDTLLEIATEPYSRIVRDATIQRFEYTFEAVWKAAQAVLRSRYGVELAAPKPIIRACHESGLLDEPQARQALAMTDDRNLTSHTYDEAIAAALFSRMDGHRALLRLWLGRLEKSDSAPLGS